MQIPAGYSSGYAAEPLPHEGPPFNRAPLQQLYQSPGYARYAAHVEPENQEDKFMDKDYSDFVEAAQFRHKDSSESEEACCGSEDSGDLCAVKFLSNPKNDTQTGRRELTEEYLEYVNDFAKANLDADAYFTGYLALMSTYTTRGSFLQSVLIIPILLFAIIAQGSMICFMLSGIDWNAASWFTTIQDVVGQKVSDKISPWILCLGLSIFLIQVTEEQKQVTIFLRAASTSIKSKSVPQPETCKTLRCFAVICLKFAKCTMPFLLRLAGMTVMCRSTTNMDVILNCTALTFVFQIDDIAVKAACPRLTHPMHHFRSEYVKHFLTPRVEDIEHPSSWSNVWQSLRVVFLCIALGGVWVFNRHIVSQCISTLLGA